MSALRVVGRLARRQVDCDLLVESNRLVRGTPAQLSEPRSHCIVVDLVVTWSLTATVCLIGRTRTSSSSPCRWLSSTERLDAPDDVEEGRILHR